MRLVNLVYLLLLLNMEPARNFTFIWNIYNFSYCCKKTDEYLSSPAFSISGCEWNVELFPRGTKETPDGIGISLRKGISDVGIPFSVVFSLSTPSDFVEKTRLLSYSFPIGVSSTREQFLRVPNAQKSRIKYDNIDTLTVKCRIINNPEVCMKLPQICNAYTFIGVKKSTFTWNIDATNSKENDFKTEELNLFENSSFTTKVSLIEGYSGEKKFEVVIKRTVANKRNLATSTISLLDAGKVFQSVRSEHFFEISTSEQVWTVSFASMKKLMSKSDKLLRFEFAVSNGDQYYSGIENIEHGQISESCSNSKSSDIYSLPVVEVPGSWKDNLHRFYSNRTFTDITIRTPTKQFPVHKAMLCAQSPVFTAMFERDMEGSQTGIVNIKDLEDETITKMLLYVYSGSVENLDWDSVLKLYFAAYKYRMTALGQQCSVFLKENLNSSNVCESLILADRHQDQQLKSVSQEFILENWEAIISSEEWKELMKENSSLAAETMHLCLSNLKTT